MAFRQAEGTLGSRQAGQRHGGTRKGQERGRKTLKTRLSGTSSTCSSSQGSITALKKGHKCGSVCGWGHNSRAMCSMRPARWCRWPKCPVKNARHVPLASTPAAEGGQEEHSQLGLHTGDPSPPPLNSTAPSRAPAGPRTQVGQGNHLRNHAPSPVPEHLRRARLTDVTADPKTTL